MSEREIHIQVVTGTEFTFVMDEDVAQQIRAAVHDNHTRVIVIPGSTENGQISVMKHHIVWFEVDDVR